MGEHTLLAIQVYGLAILISILVAVMIRVIVNTLTWMQKKPEPAAAPAPAPAVVKKDDTDDLVAAISAAVYAVLGAHRIVHIEPTGFGHGWTAEGRMAHHTSHAVPRKSR